MYAPERFRTILLRLRRMSASASAGMTARPTDMIESSSVYSSPCTKKERYFGRKEKLKKFAGDMPANRLDHHIILFLDLFCI